MQKNKLKKSVRGTVVQPLTIIQDSLTKGAFYIACKSNIILSMLIFLMCFTGCSNSRIDLVRNGTLDMDESKTIGDVLDNKSLLSNGRWTYFQAEDGSNVVQFNADIDGLQEQLDLIEAEFKANPTALTMGALASGGEMGAVGLGMLLNSEIKIDKCEYQIQFLLSKRDDDRFEIGNSSFTAEVSLPNGKKSNQTFDDEEDDILGSLYENEKAPIAFVVISKFMISGFLQQIMQQ